MGTTLTGTTPATTYDSLIKVTDNGPIGTSLKTLTDGLGNDSALALSTKALQIKKTDTIQTSAGCISHFSNDYIYYFGGTAGIVISDFASTARLQIYNNNAIAFETGTTERMRITSTGNVGIGTSAPAYKLEVFDAGGSSLAVGASTGKGFLYADNGGATLGALSAIPLRFSVNGSEHMRITSSGKVGINTTSALGQLNIKNESAGATTNALALYNTPSNTENTGVAIEFYPNVGVDDRCARISSVNPTTTGTNLSDLRFFTSNNAAPTEKMRITHTGNVGIGTSAPTSLLNLSSATPILTLNQTIANSEQGIEFDNSDTNYAFIRANAQTGLITYAAGLTGGAGYVHRFIVDGSERLRITPDGLTFNGDTAANNALSDYEQGTWTMGLAFGGASTGITYFLNSGTYTKIGRQVTVNGILSLTSKGSATGAATLTGLPFTIGTGFTHYSAPATTASTITSTGSIQGRGGSASTFINLEQHDPASGANAALTDANFANTSDITISFTYFV